MQIYDLLMKDHEKVKGLLSELVSLSKGDDERRTQLVEQIRDDLIPHARAEEAVLYNSLRAIDMAKDLAWHGYEEHVEAETLLRSVQAMDLANVDFKKTAQKLKEAVEHHIQEEEGKIFSAARQLFIDEEAEAMGEAFERMKADVSEGSFVQTSVEMIANMMPPRLSKAVRDFTYRA